MSPSLSVNEAAIQPSIGEALIKNTQIDGLLTDSWEGKWGM